MTKTKITISIIAIAILVTIFLILPSSKPAELKKLETQIEQKNSGKSFDLNYEYTGPNTFEPLPFNYN